MLKKGLKGLILSVMREYERVKKTCENEIKTAVKVYDKNLANNAKKNPKMVYSYMNSKKTVKDSIRALNDEIGNRVEDPGEIVKILNNQFKSVFELDNGEVPNVNEIKESVKEKKIERG